ncbi:helix-turn-helix domain-containing protein [Luedemannella flava]
MGADDATGVSPDRLASVTTLAELAEVLHALRRRYARRTGQPVPTYRDIAARAGWSHSIIGQYFTGQTLPPPDRFDVLVRLLGASPESRAGWPPRSTASPTAVGSARPRTPADPRCRHSCPWTWPTSSGAGPNWPDSTNWLSPRAG